MRETQRDPTTINRFFKMLAQMPAEELSALKAFISLKPDAAQVDFPMYCLRIPAFMETCPIQRAAIIGPLTYDRATLLPAGPVAVFSQHYLIQAGRAGIREIPFTHDELLLARYDRKQPYFPYERLQFARALRAIRPYGGQQQKAHNVVTVRSCGPREFALSFKS